MVGRSNGHQIGHIMETRANTKVRSDVINIRSTSKMGLKEDIHVMDKCVWLCILKCPRPVGVFQASKLIYL